MSDFFSLPYREALPDVLPSVVVLAFVLGSGYAAFLLWRRISGIGIINGLTPLFTLGMSEREALERLSKTAPLPHRNRIKRLLAEMPSRPSDELAQAVRQAGREWPRSGGSDE